jgi:membrane protease subunit (stomatin/prohibitin family)
MLGENLKTVFDLPAYYDEIAAGVKARVADDFGKQGLELVDFIISAITPPEEVQKMIDERSSMGVIGDMSAYMQYKAAQSIPDAAKNPGGAAGTGMGLGLGMGYGQMMAGAFGQGQQQQGGAGTQTVPCVKCGSGLQPGSKFCSNCGATQQTPQTATVPCPKCQSPVQVGAKFCSECGQSMVSQPCSNCQSPVQPGAKFCANCGTPA